MSILPSLLNVIDIFYYLTNLLFIKAKVNEYAYIKIEREPNLQQDIVIMQNMSLLISIKVRVTF